jgi:hypothetical protein
VRTAFNTLWLPTLNHASKAKAGRTVPMLGDFVSPDIRADEEFCTWTKK